MPDRRCPSRHRRMRCDLLLHDGHQNYHIVAGYMGSPARRESWTEVLPQQRLPVVGGLA